MKPDLNLLVVLDALCRTGSVSRASRALSLSQPAISHALSRLREATGDPLFTRSGRGLAPTPRALALKDGVGEIVAAGQACLRPEAFDPAKDAVRFRIGVSDYAGLVLLPGLVADLRMRAPHAVIEALPVGPDLLQRLADGALDLSFWGTQPPKPRVRYQELFQEEFVLVLRQDHPQLVRPEVGLDDYLALDHAIVSLGDPGLSPVDAALAKRGRVRRIGLVSPSFAANLAAVAASDLVATVPARLTAGLGPGLVTRTLPLEPLRFDYGLIWHPRSETGAALRWLRGVIAEVAAACVVPTG
jgi:DNA-binding transcriptional LysR family regulator